MKKKKYKIVIVLLSVLGFLYLFCASVFASELLQIEAESVASAINDYGGIRIDVNLSAAIMDDFFYIIERSEDKKEWNRIGLAFQYLKATNRTSVKSIKVLNVYPDNNSFSFPDSMKEGMTEEDYDQYRKAYKIPIGEFTFSDGTKKKLPKSAALKIWMEGGTYKDEDGIEIFSNISEYQGQKMIAVDLMSMSEYNSNVKALSDIYEYDVLFFGTWDANGWNDLSDQARQVTKEFIECKKGVIFGHDTIAYRVIGNGVFSGEMELENFFDLRSFMGFQNIPLKYKKASLIQENQNGLLLPYTYQIWGGSDETGNVAVRFSRSEYAMHASLTTFPNDLLSNKTDKTLRVPNTHTAWMPLQKADQNIVSFANNEYSHLPAMVSQRYNHNPNQLFNWYLCSGASKYTCYMIQTGHSRCASLLDERKLIANVISNCCKIEHAREIKEGNATKLDASAQDYEPPVVERPALSYNEKTQQLGIRLKGMDYGSDYYFRAQLLKGATGIIATSNIEQVTVTTGIEYYYVLIDEKKENTDFSKADAVVWGKIAAENGFKINKSKFDHAYIHVKAVDYAGNVSKPVTYSIKELLSIEMEALQIQAQERNHLYQATDTNGIRTYYINGTKEFILTAGCSVLPFATELSQPIKNKINSLEVQTSRDQQVGQSCTEYDVTGDLDRRLKIFHIEQKRMENSSKLQLKVIMAFRSNMDGACILMEPGGTAIINEEEKEAVLEKEHKLYLYCDGRSPSVQYNNFKQWYNASNLKAAGTLDLVFTDTGSGFSNYKVHLQRVDTQNEEVLMTKQGTKEKESLSFYNVKEEGYYQYKIIGIDNVGNRTEKNIFFGVDKTAPIIEGVETCYGWTNQDVELNVRSKDDLSGVKEIRLLNEAGSVIACVNGNKFSYTFEEEQNHIYYIEAEDRAGNQSIRSSFYVKIDKTKPSIKGVELVEDCKKIVDGQEVYYIKENKIRASASELSENRYNSGLKVFLLKTDEDKVLQEKRHVNSGGEIVGENDFKIEYVVESSQESGRYSLTAIDYAGNVRRIFVVPPFCLMNRIHRYIYHDNYEEEYGYYRLYE